MYVSRYATLFAKITCSHLPQTTSKLPLKHFSQNDLTAPENKHYSDFNTRKIRKLNLLVSIVAKCVYSKTEKCPTRKQRSTSTRVNIVTLTLELPRLFTDCLRKMENSVFLEMSSDFPRSPRGFDHCDLISEWVIFANRSSLIRNLYRESSTMR